MICPLVNRTNTSSADPDAQANPMQRGRKPEVRMRTLCVKQTVPVYAPNSCSGANAKVRGNMML